MDGMVDQQELLFERIAYTAPKLVNNDIWGTMRDVYNCGDLGRRTAALYKIQTWFRMAICRKKFLKTRWTVVRF